SSTSASVFADSPTRPFHSEIFGKVRVIHSTSSFHLLTSTNKWLRSHLSESGISARVGTSVMARLLYDCWSARATLAKNQIICVIKAASPSCDFAVDPDRAYRRLTPANA